MSGAPAPAPNERCSECDAHLTANRDALLFAAASAGIERGVSTTYALRAYLRVYHREGHRSADALPGRETP